jgi:hypothetical protein
MMLISVFRTVVSSLTVAGALVLGPVAQAEDKADPLDGKTFLGQIGEKGKAKAEYDEEMSFKDGKMVSSACVPLGFSSFPYKSTVKGNVIEFMAEATNPAKGTLKWKGVIKGNKLSATSVWTKPGEAPDESWLKAKLKK